MCIRTAELSDIPALCRLYQALYNDLTALGLPFDLSIDELPSIVTAQLKSKLCYVAVWEADGTVTGFVSAAMPRMDSKLNFRGQTRIGVINDIYVEPTVRGQGAASALRESAEAWMRANGLTVAWCHVQVNNAAGAAFWQRQGYDDLGKMVYKTL